MIMILFRWTTFKKYLNFNTKEDYELDRIFNVKEIKVYKVVAK